MNCGKHKSWNDINNCNTGITTLTLMRYCINNTYIWHKNKHKFFRHFNLQGCCIWCAYSGFFCRRTSLSERLMGRLCYIISVKHQLKPWQLGVSMTLEFGVCGFNTVSWGRSTCESHYTPGLTEEFWITVELTAGRGNCFLLHASCHPLKRAANTNTDSLSHPQHPLFKSKAEAAKTN